MIGTYGKETHPLDTRLGSVHKHPLHLSHVLTGRVPILIVLVVLVVFFSISASGFATTGSATNIAVSTALFLLIALGETFVIISGGIDISVSSNLALTGVVGGALMSSMYSGHGEGIVPTIIVGAICIGVGAIGGMANGLIVAFIGVTSLIATLGTWGAFYGLAELFATEHAIGTLPPFSFALGNSGPGVSYVVWIAVACVIVFSFVLHRTRFGRYTLVVGANRDAGIRAGIHVKRHLFAIYTVAGLMAGLAGFLSVAHFQTASPDTGSSYLLIAIAAVVIGGTPLVGGEGSVWATLIGALIISVLENGFVLLGVNAFWQLVAVGVATVAAVYFGQVQGSLRAKLLVAQVQKETAKGNDRGAAAGDRQHATNGRVSIPQENGGAQPVKQD